MPETENSRIVVIYHADCADGFGAAWSAWKKFGTSAIYIAAKHGAEIPAETKGAHVYLLDYSFNAERMRELIATTTKVTLIDHHETAEPYQQIVAESIFDEKHSGSVLAWNHFFPGENTPTALLYIEAGDLWKFDLPDSHEIIESIHMIEFEFAPWDKMIAELSTDAGRARHIDKGAISLLRTQKMVTKAVDEAEEVEFEGIKCLAVNSMFCVSEIGAALCRKLPPIGIIWSRRKDKTVVSLRSDGSIDVAKLAEKHGGGGHPTSASFANCDPWNLDKIL